VQFERTVTACNIAHGCDGIFTYVNGTEDLIEYEDERARAWSRAATAS